jgi:hypothetical protein
LRDIRECRAARISAKAHIGIDYWTHSMHELSGVNEDSMPGRNIQRKLGTSRGSPRRSRTAKAMRISHQVVKSQCACERDGWGRVRPVCSSRASASEFPSGLGRAALTPAWLLERGRFEPTSPFDSRAFRKLVGIGILRRKIFFGSAAHSAQFQGHTKAIIDILRGA